MDDEKLKMLKSSNEQLAEAIRAGEGSEEDLRVMFEAYQENLEIIEKLESPAS